MTRFDDALENAVEITGRHLEGQRTPITIVRDVIGQLSVVLDDNVLGMEEWHTLAESLDRRLGPYSSGSRTVLLKKSDLIDEQDVLQSPDRVRIKSDLSNQDVWLVDRLLTNEDWTRKPRTTQALLPTGVGFSLKGGVGRSTALAVLAWRLARQSKRVVVIDMDLEAPGLGSLLLEELPDYGVVDWMVESLVQTPDATFLKDCLARSGVADDAPGVVQVMPAFGRRTRDYVAKVGRAFAPKLSSEGDVVGASARLSAILEVLKAEIERPDVVLLDARAGLHDSGAAAVTQLGAEVFLFARDEPQGWHAYRLLLEHLAKAPAVIYGMPDEDLRWRLKMVAAQIDKTEGALHDWTEASYETWSALYDDESKGQYGVRGTTVFARDDSSAPHHPLPIYFDAGLRGISFSHPGRRPAWPVVEASFGEFLVSASVRLLPDESPDAPTVRANGR